MKKSLINKISILSVACVLIQTISFAADKAINELKNVSVKENRNNIILNISTTQKLKTMPRPYKLSKNSFVISLHETKYKTAKEILKSDKKYSDIKEVSVEFKPYTVIKNSGYTRIIITMGSAEESKKIIVKTKVASPFSNYLFIAFFVALFISAISVGAIVLYRKKHYEKTNTDTPEQADTENNTLTDENSADDSVDMKNINTEIHDTNIVTENLSTSEMSDNFAEQQENNSENDIFPSPDDMIDDILNNENVIDEITNEIKETNNDIENILNEEFRGDNSDIDDILSKTLEEDVIDEIPNETADTNDDITDDILSEALEEDVIDELPNETADINDDITDDILSEALEESDAEVKNMPETNSLLSDNQANYAENKNIPTNTSSGGTFIINQNINLQIKNDIKDLDIPENNNNETLQIIPQLTVPAAFPSEEELLTENILDDIEESYEANINKNTETYTSIENSEDLLSFEQTQDDIADDEEIFFDNVISENQIETDEISEPLNETEIIQPEEAMQAPADENDFFEDIIIDDATETNIEDTSVQTDNINEIFAEEKSQEDNIIEEETFFDKIVSNDTINAEEKTDVSEILQEEPAETFKNTNMKDEDMTQEIDEIIKKTDNAEVTVEFNDKNTAEYYIDSTSTTEENQQENDLDAIDNIEQFIENNDEKSSYLTEESIDNLFISEDDFSEETETKDELSDNDIETVEDNTQFNQNDLFAKDIQSEPIKEPQITDDSEPSVLAEQEIAENKNIYLIRHNGEYSLIGIVGEDISIIERFEEKPIKETISLRYNETSDNGDIYIARVGSWRALIVVSDEKMENILTLS